MEINNRPVNLSRKTRRISLGYWLSVHGTVKPMCERVMRIGVKLVYDVRRSLVGYAIFEVRLAMIINNGPSYTAMVMKLG